MIRAGAGGSQHARRLESPVCAASGVQDASEGHARRESARAAVEAECTNGAAQPADRAGGVGITSTCWIPPRQWGRGGEVERRRTKMLGLKRLSVAQYERALVFRERSLERVLTRGVYWLWDPMARLTVQVYDATRAGARVAASRRAGGGGARLAGAVRADRGTGRPRGRPGLQERPPRGRARAGYASVVLAWFGERARRSARHRERIRARREHGPRADAREGRGGRERRHQHGRGPGYVRGSADRRRRAARRAEAGSVGVLEVPARAARGARGPASADDGSLGPGNPDARQGEPAREPDRAVAGDGCGEGARDGQQLRGLRLQGAAVRAA